MLFSFLIKAHKFRFLWIKHYSIEFKAVFKVFKIPTKFHFYFIVAFIRSFYGAIVSVISKP